MKKHLKRFAKAKLCLSLAVCLVFTMGFGGVNAAAAQTDPGLTDLNGIKVIEVYSRLTDSGEIETDYIPTPRELDEYHRMEIYGLADVPYAVSELRLRDTDALKTYSSANTKYEALSMAISDQVYDGLKKGQGIFFTGADGDTAVGMAGGIRRAYPDARLGMIYMDARGNIRSVSSIMGVDKDTKLWSLSSGKNDVFDALLFTDGRDLDSGSNLILDAVDTSGSYCNILNTDAFKDEGKWKNAVDVFADEVDAIYLHVDADFLHQGYISHIDAGAGEGPDIWTMMENLETVMGTGKVVAINLASMYSADPGYEKVSREPVLSPPNQRNEVTLLEEVWQGRGYEIPQYHSSETEEERINRFSTISIRTAIRMVSTMLGNWEQMPAAPGADFVIPAGAPERAGNVKSLKVVEILTRTVKDGIFVGRNSTPPNNTTDPTYKYEERGNLIPENDHIDPNIFPNPREIDDFKLAGLYDLAGVPSDVTVVDITDEESDAKYPDLARFEGFSREISNEVYDGLMAGKPVFLDAMGCPPSTGIAGGMRRAFGNDAKLGVIYIDAHGDINTCDSTLSGGIGGMCLAPIMGIDAHPTAQNWWNSSSDNMRPFDELLHCCANNLDFGIDTHDPENPYEFGEMLNIEKAVSDKKFIVDENEFQDTDYFAEELADFASKVDAIYFHIDMDFLDNSATLNSGSADCGYYTGRPGPDIWKTLKNVKAIMDTDKVAVMYLASVTSNSNAGAVNDANLYRRGYAFPDVVGEVKEGTAYDQVIRTNRISSYGILQGMRIIGEVLGNWENHPEIDRKGTVTLTIGNRDYIDNGVSKSMQAAPVTVKGRTLVPAHFLVDAMGADVRWDSETKTASVTLNGETLRFKDGELAPGMDVPAQTVNSRMMIPLRYAAERLNASLSWDAAARTVKIVK